MSHRFTDGVYRPPEVDVYLEGIVYTIWPTVATLRSLDRRAGVAIGSCILGFPTKYFEDATPDMGREARVSLGGRTIFRGVVGDAPTEIDARRDERQLLCYDDKWLMAANTIGQIGRGTQGTPTGATGFADVGFDCTFNRDGRPNKDPDVCDFRTGTGAVYWTLQDIMVFIFTYYISTSAVTLNSALLGSNFDDRPSHLALSGQTALQAVDLVCRCAGQSWGLTPDRTASAFASVRSGYGDQRTISFFPPRRAATVVDATSLYPRSAKGGKSIRDCKDVYQAVSAPIIKDHTYQSEGADPLLIPVAGFKDPEYDYRWTIDVTKYAAHNMGCNLSAGSRPKPILSSLVTRLSADGTAYVTALQILTTPLLAQNEHVSKPYIWIRWDDGAGGQTVLRLVTGGARFDAEHGLLDLKDTVKLAPMTKEKPPLEDESLVLSDLSGVALYFTCATRLELVESASTSVSNQYLPAHVTEVINKADLVPERRERVILPNLAGDPNDYVLLAAAAEETYVDVYSHLADAIAAARAGSEAIESPLAFEFPFLPDLALGDLVTIRGRDLGATGSEVITSLSYRFRNGVPDCVEAQASNVMAGVNPERYTEI